MFGDDDIGSLQQAEAECVAKFKARAALIRAANPALSREIAFAMAVEQLPRAAVRYQSARARLGLAGVRALPLK
jgi:hypothetical protein